VVGGVAGERGLAWIVVTHDRAFLESTASRIVELSRAYPGGAFAAAGKLHGVSAAQAGVSGGAEPAGAGAGEHGARGPAVAGERGAGEKDQEQEQDRGVV